jgi:hypothetical protein
VVGDDADDTLATQQPSYYSPPLRDTDDGHTTINRATYYSPNHCWFLPDFSSNNSKQQSTQTTRPTPQLLVVTRSTPTRLLVAVADADNTTTPRSSAAR